MDELFCIGPVTGGDSGGASDRTVGGDTRDVTTGPAVASVAYNTEKSAIVRKDMVQYLSFGSILDLAIMLHALTAMLLLLLREWSIHFYIPCRVPCET